MEQSVRGAAMLEQAAPHVKLEEEVQRLQLENHRLKRNQNQNVASAGNQLTIFR